MKTIYANTQQRRRWQIGLSAAAIALASLIGCNSNDSNPAGPQPDNRTQQVSGRYEGNSMAKRSDLQGTVVVAYAVASDGSFGSDEVGRDTTDAQGNFQIMTERQGAQNWVIVTAQAGMQWMTCYRDTLTENDADTARPMNFESTLQSQVYLALQKTDEGRKVNQSQVTSSIDVNVAASARSQYQSGDSTFRRNMVSSLSAEVKAQFEAQVSYMKQASAQYSSDTAKTFGSIRRAEANLTVLLVAAHGDSTQTRQAENAHLQAMLSAYARYQSDSNYLSMARSYEASYHATVMATASVTDSTRNAMRRRSLHIFAMASDTAAVRTYRRAHASEAQLQAVITASANFERWADTSGSDASRDSAVSRYRADLRSVFQVQGAGSDSSFAAMANLTSTATLSNQLNTTSSSLQTLLTADAATQNASGMGQDLQTSNTQATTQIMAQWQSDSHNTGNADQNSAMAQVMAFVTVSGKHG